ncbi:excisionase [Mesorhizobium amorphae]|uniref:excisionase n=1 Tax=Mesorhizobium amorphae TaxID=71433 RepID=UPI0021B39530|nr:excisionase [Mesorhizobium amorphae]
MSMHFGSVEIGDDVSRDAPIRLDVAAKIAFPDGSMGAKGLRKERDKGNLVTEMIAGKEYVTLAEIERMRERCRVQRKAPDLSGARKAARQTDHSAAKQDGSSRTAGNDPALALAMASVMRLKSGSQPTSPKSTSQRATATVTPIRSK